MIKVRLKLTPFQILVHLLAWGLVAWLAWDAWTGNLTVNPIQAATQRTGKNALVLLVLSLACTPLNTLFGLRQALTVRRSLGLYAFMFAAMHFAIFIWIDYGFDWEFIRSRDYRQKLHSRWRNGSDHPDTPGGDFLPVVDETPGKTLESLAQAGLPGSPAGGAAFCLGAQR
jgi:hypothetical protein